MNALQKRGVILGLLMTNFIFVSLFIVWAMYRHGSIGISVPVLSLPSFSLPSFALKSPLAPNTTSVVVNNTPVNAPVIAPVVSDAVLPSVCYSLGPFNTNQKERADILMGDYQLKGQYSENIQALSDRYEFYWVLGNNQMQAQALFNKQNESIFKGKGLVMSKDKDGQYIVSLAFLPSENAARQVATKMAQSAAGAGGSWKWRKQTADRSVFYNFKPLSKSNFDIIRALQTTFSGEVRLEQTACR